MKYPAIFTMLCALTLAACNLVVDDPTDIDTDTDTDASEVTCVDVCVHGTQLGCKFVLGSPGRDYIWGTDDDLSCMEVCNGLWGPDGDSFYKLDCFLRKNTCEDMAECALE